MDPVIELQVTHLSPQAQVTYLLTKIASTDLRGAPIDFSGTSERSLGA